MIGKCSGKVVGIGTKSKTCRTCSFYQRKEKDIPTHDCHKNFAGSAKAMESAIVLDMIQQVNDSECPCKVKKIVGDDDTTTIAKVRQQIDPNIEKASDKNHVRKNLGNALYGLQKKHKSLTVRVITSLQKNFDYAVMQHRNNPEHLAAALQACYLHPFGDHTKCGTWCGFLKDPAYRHPNLPYGKDLTDQNLKTDLEALFKTFIDSKEKLACLGSSQGNESFNNTVASKAPKTRHYCGSSSLSTRVKMAALQKNEGYIYPTMV